jgi:hypothetical protein
MLVRPWLRRLSCVSLSPQGSRLSAKYRSEKNVCCSSERRTPVERSDRGSSGVSESASPSQLRRRKACNLSLKQNLKTHEGWLRILHTLLIARRVWKPTITGTTTRSNGSSFGARNTPAIPAHGKGDRGFNFRPTSTGTRIGQCFPRVENQHIDTIFSFR